DRFENAKEKAEGYQMLFQSKREKMMGKGSEQGLAELGRIQRAMKEREEVLGRFRVWIWKEYERFEEFSKQERIHWSKYFAEIRLQSYRKRVNAWKSFTESINNYEAEQKRREEAVEMEKIIAVRRGVRVRVRVREVKC